MRAAARLAAWLPLLAAYGCEVKVSVGDGDRPLGTFTCTSLEDGECVAPTDHFAPTAEVVHMTYRTKDLPKNGDVYLIRWIAEDVGQAAAPNTVVASLEEKVTGDTSLATSYSVKTNFTRPTAGWPAGTYRVEVERAGKLETTARFVIQPGPAPVPAPAEDPVDVEGKKLLAIGQQIVDASRSGDCATFMARVQDLDGGDTTVSPSLAAKVMEKYGSQLQAMLESTAPVLEKCRNDPAWIAAMTKNADTWGRRMVGIAGRIAGATSSSGGDCAKLGGAVEPIVAELTVLRRHPPTGAEVKPQLATYAGRFTEALAPARPLLDQCRADGRVASLVPLLGLDAFSGD